MQDRKPAKECVCHNKCGKMAVAYFPKYDKSTESYPYCLPCLTKLKADLIKTITSDGRTN